MCGVSAAIMALTSPGDSIVVQTPLYPPLMQTVLRNDRQLLENRLVVVDGGYRINFNELEQLFQTHKPRVLVFCSPHNPVGRVWKEEEVGRIIALIQKYDAYLVSDEIHADIVFPPQVHIPALLPDERANSRIIMLNSASKSFNVAGLATAYALIPAPTLRKTFRQQLRRMNFHGVNLFGMTAMEAAYGKGERWLEELLRYLLSNRDYMADTLDRGLPALKYYFPEGTYLFWLDFNSLGLPDGEIRERLINVARVGLNDGITFSRDTGGFWRFNFAAPRSMVEEGLERIVKAFQ
jgi:cystathionine beta-lyase